MQGQSTAYILKKHVVEWHWRLIDREALWKEVISEIYGFDSLARPNQMGTSVWNAISEVNDHRKIRCRA